MRQFAPAKVNLALHVTGRRDDGYHLLDSLVVFAEVGDWVTATRSDHISLTVTGLRAAGVPADHGNLMWQAAEMLARPVALTLDKHLPHAGGIGGGSADAAATLRAIRTLYDLPSPDPASLLALGADLPVCYAGHPARMSGIGEVIESVPPLPPLWCVLVNAGQPVPTGPIFRGLTSVANPPLPDPTWHDTPGFLTWLGQTRNDLEAPARAQVPEIDGTLAALASTQGCALARMSGSGGTCFGLYLDATSATDAAAALQSRYPDWWVAEARIQAPGQP